MSRARFAAAAAATAAGVIRSGALHSDAAQGHPAEGDLLSPLQTGQLGRRRLARGQGLASAAVLHARGTAVGDGQRAAGPRPERRGRRRRQGRRQGLLRLRLQELLLLGRRRRTVLGRRRQLALRALALGTLAFGPRIGHGRGRLVGCYRRRLLDGGSAAVHGGAVAGRRQGGPLTWKLADGRSQGTSQRSPADAGRGRRAGGGGRGRRAFGRRLARG